MGQIYSRAYDMEHHTLVERYTNLEQTNLKLRQTITERDNSIQQLRATLTKTKVDLETTQTNFFSIEQQLREIREKYDSIKPINERLQSELAEASQSSIAHMEASNILKLANADLEDRIAEATTRINSLRDELEKVENENTDTIDGLKTKNAELREKLQGQQEELSALKKSISMINNIVDNT